MVDKTEGFKTIVKDEMVVFDHDRGLGVNKAINGLIRDIDKALILMKGGWVRRVSQDMPEVNTRTYQRLLEIQAALEELAMLTKPEIKTRF